MKRFALAAALALFIVAPARAAVIDLTPDNGKQAMTTPRTAHDPGITSHTPIVTPLFRMSEVPEPQVFAMMLVGLILIGYRVGRSGSDKFR